MRIDATPVGVGVPDRSSRLIARWVIVSLTLLAVLTALVGLAFAGSSVRIADGVQIAGVDVGGLTKSEARTLLQHRSQEVAHVPIVFTAGGKEYPIKATTLGVEADWASAIQSATREGQGFGPVRVGNVEAYATIAVRSQVTGQLDEVHVTEGNTVKKGDILYTLDKRPLESQLQ